MKTASKEEKQMWVEDWAGSGQSAWKYAKSNGLNYQTFQNWIKEEGSGAGDNAESGFVEVTGKAQAAGSYEEIVIEGREILVRMPLCCGAELLRAAVEALKGAA
jgi:hypothetical protein